MPKKASTHGATAPSKSKTARSKTAKAKSKDKAAPRKEARKAASEAASKRTAAAARQGESPRRSRSHSLSPDDRPNPRFTYRDHSPGAESPSLTGTPGSTKDPTPSQDAPVDDAASSEAKAASTSVPAKNLTLVEGSSKARAQAAKAASPKRAHEGAAAAKKRAAPGSPTSEFHCKGILIPVRLSDEDEEEGAVTEPQEISNDLDEQQERYQAARRSYASHAGVSSRILPTGYVVRVSYVLGADTSHRMRGLGLPYFWSISVPLVVLTMGALRVAPMSVPRFKMSHSLSVTLRPLGVCYLHHTEFLLRNLQVSVRNRKTVVDFSPCGPENTTTQSQAEDLFWRWVSLKNFTVQELKELREDRLLSYILDQRDLRIEFAHLVAKRQLHSVMEGLRQQSKSSAQDERGYDSVNPGTVHRKAAKRPRDYYAPAVDPRSQQPSGSQPGAGLPVPTSSVTRGNPATSQAAGASQSAAALGRPAPHGSGARRSNQGSLLSDEVRQLRDCVYAIEIALGLGPGGQAATQAGKPGAGGPRDPSVDRRVPASALKELRRGLDALSHEVHGRMPSYEPQGYSYHSAYGYSSYPSSSHSVPSYPSYDSRGYQPVYHSQTSTPAAPVVQRTQPRFEEVSSHLGLPPSEKEDPADRDTA
ncbi:LOW QUALITY PROTEIN: Hypothetical protein PHPALM_4608 [Phytophthora palmivora]|uniref:ATP-binding cassette (ABC) Superfamily n=1 Tax=Phytophthora palmivora TaxID=4796 RepID=A0A2P4YJH3_9STRA|nr:LOW QUALITY PROTEIN: Hypothetical protein PHPALM_4608 [Phytophthora palmivora]